MGHFISTLYSLHWVGIKFECSPSILLHFWTFLNVSVPEFPVICLLTCSWKGPRQDAGEEISRSKFGRNRRSTCSGSVVLGRYRNVSVTYVVNTL